MYKKFKKSIIEFVVLILSIPILIPFYMLVINSFKNKAEAADMNIMLPSSWNIINNYTTLIKTGNIMTGFKNSIILTIAPTIISVLVVSITAFIIQRRKQKLSSILYTFFIIGMILPSFIVPTIMLTKALHIPSYLGLILVYATGMIPIGTFLYVGYYKSIPREIDESALIDGCGIIRFFYQIIFPLVKPITSTFIILAFLTWWNDFGTSLYFISGQENQTLTLTMFYFFGPHSADWHLVFACVVVTTMPVVVVYLFLQKYIVAGMTGGSVKG